MNSVAAAIARNSVLIGILTFSSINYYFRWLGWKDLLGVQILAGFTYIFLSCYEFINASYKASLPVQRYAYFTSAYIMGKALKTGIFLSFAIMLYLAESSVRYIYPICLIICTTEAIITYLKYKDALCFINIYANYILLVQDRFTRVFANEIALVEFRHDIFYFVKKNRKSVEIKLEHLQEREAFVQALNVWLNRNRVPVSDESKSKIEKLIAS